MTNGRVACREELYTDVRLNDTLCERYQAHMGQYGRKVLKRHDKVLTASSDIGMFCSRSIDSSVFRLLTTRMLTGVIL
jgi:hypothetical protein